MSAFFSDSPQCSWSSPPCAPYPCYPLILLTLSALVSLFSSRVQAFTPYVSSRLFSLHSLRLSTASKIRPLFPGLCESPRNWPVLYCGSLPGLLFLVQHLLRTRSPVDLGWLFFCPPSCFPPSDVRLTLNRCSSFPFFLTGPPVEFLHHWRPFFLGGSAISPLLVFSLLWCTLALFSESLIECPGVLFCFLQPKTPPPTTRELPLSPTSLVIPLDRSVSPAPPTPACQDFFFFPSRDEATEYPLLSSSHPLTVFWSGFDKKPLFF